MSLDERCEGVPLLLLGSSEKRNPPASGNILTYGGFLIRIKKYFTKNIAIL